MLVMIRRRIVTLICLSIVFIPILSILYHRMMATTTTKLAASPSFSKGAIVIGSGLAGLSAASQLIAQNVPVRLLERSSKPGGNSIKASSGINGAPTKYQLVTDDAFYDDTVRSVGAVIAKARERREKLISTLTNSSSGAITWLVEEKGIDLSRVAQLGGHTRPRTHRGSGQTPPGAAIITALLKALQTSPLFQLQTSCLVTHLLHSGDQVSGVEYTCDGKTGTLHGPVVVASGGFAGDAEGMLAQYRPDLAGFPSTNEPRPGSQGLLTAAGAQLLDMDLVQVHPTGFVDPKNPSAPLKFLAGEVLRGEGGLLIQNSKRFANEMETREHITKAIMRTPATDASPKQWDIQIVLDEGCYHAVPSHVDFYVWKGLMHKTTVSELGTEALQEIQAYADAAAGRIPDQFGRTVFAHWALAEVKPDSVVYVGRVTPVVHFTMGGVAINERSEVLDANDKPIRGVWAAGEVTGGIHGENRLGGSSLLECVVFGRGAGDQAAVFYEEG